MNQNQMFSEMTGAALARLAGRDPAALARAAGVSWDPAALTVESLGVRYTLALPDYRCRPEMEPWQYLVVLHHLDLADGTPVSDRLCTFGALKDGLIRGGGFDRTSAEALARLLHGLEPDRLRRAVSALGGREIQTNADFTARLPFLPRIPLVLKAWYADEDFPASGKLLLTESADRYLTIEDAVTVGEVTLEKLKQALE
ncbi:MAG: DUF3786 domain-containing protein [Eubacteriales bacterium]|nr:DUF3786 domain-containing protein [Eubacteriales bacterium]